MASASASSLGHGHGRSESSERTLALRSISADDHRPKDPLVAHILHDQQQHLGFESAQGTEYGLDPAWDEAYAATGLGPAARTYLLQRHGTLDLDPTPSASDADPYNWRPLKKAVMLLLVAAHAGMAMATAGAVGGPAACAALTAEFGTSASEPRASGGGGGGGGGGYCYYLAAVQMAVLGVAPLVWRPLAEGYGRRPVFLLSLVLSAGGNVACALSRSYALLMFFRALVAFAISPASALGSAVVAETFLKKDRARYIGVWMVMVTLGVPLGPLVFGFVALRVNNYRFLFWILAIVNGVQFILYFFFGPETLYLRGEDHHSPPHMGSEKGAANFVGRYLHFRRINPRKVTIGDYFAPLRMVARPCAVLPALAYSTVFLFGSILTTVELPQLLEDKFKLNTRQVGLQFIGVMVGSLVGEPVGGALSDVWMRRRKNTLSSPPQPEHRLWLSYLGLVLTVAGVAVFLVTAEKAPAGRWTVVPVVGTAIAAVGNQVATTVLVTYAVDCAAEEEAASVGVFVSLCRQMIGFLGPFWFPEMFSSVGLANSSAIVAGLVIALGIVPTSLLQLRGQRWR